MRATSIVVAMMSVALAIVASMFAVLNLDTPTPPSMAWGSKWIETAYPAAALVIVAIGAAIAIRQPRHAVAWCFLLWGLGAELWLALRGYGQLGLVTAPESVPEAATVLWFTRWFRWVPQSALLLGILLFPDGRLPERGWRPVAWLVVVATLTQATTDALRVSLLHPLATIEAPTSAPLDWLVFLGALMWAVAGLSVGVSLFVRFRRSRGIERQQLKWIAYATTIVLFMLLPAQTLARLMLANDAISGQVVNTVSLIVVFSIPLSAGLAILRYRLFDIDLLINRTLVYGLVSATLGATYLVAVLLLQGLLRPLTGGSEFAVAISTLFVVALFQPIRSRAQDLVDRRFYRARYDAARTVDAFTARLRADVDLDSVRADLVGVVRDTIHPAHASVWLRRGKG